uniref:Early salt stress and cold acclimation-induced protein 2-1 n=1 Tax=Thinopyrum elongatum TaxID=4588 RepID=Q4KXD9_THIEL|nr:early salt stress and cold acclimation-induced protein 2-1 [Thinopyrum elongatum]
MASPRGLAGLLCFALVAAAASAAQYRVGEQRGWSVPAAGAEPLNTWSGRMRFVIGDQLLFVYPKDTDSVLLVDQAAYNACNTTTYVSKFQGGSTVFTLDRSGPFFFISGNEASCKADQKLIVVVLSVDHTPPGLLPAPPPPSMPPSSAPPMPSPMSPPSMTPPSAAPMPSPMSPPSMTPPSAAPMPSPMSPPSMTPPSAAPMPSPMSPPSMTPPSAAPMPSPMSPAAAPGATPDSPPSPMSPAPSPGTPGGGSSPGTPGSDTSSPPAPGADGANSTTPGSGAAPAMAGLIGTLAAGIGYAMLAI